VRFTTKLVNVFGFRKDEVKKEWKKL